MHIHIERRLYGNASGVGLDDAVGATGWWIRCAVRKIGNLIEEEDIRRRVFDKALGQT